MHAVHEFAGSPIREGSVFAYSMVVLKFSLS